MEPRLLKFDPGFALAPIARKPFAVVPEKVELLNVRPPDVAVAPGAQPEPKHPFVKPAMKTSSARTSPWARAKSVTAKMLSASGFTITRMRFIMILLPPFVPSKTLFDCTLAEFRAQGRGMLTVDVLRGGR